MVVELDDDEEEVEDVVLVKRNGCGLVVVVLKGKVKLFVKSIVLDKLKFGLRFIWKCGKVVDLDLDVDMN